MAQNRGKQFEKVVEKAFLKIPDVSIDRLHDQTTGYKGSQNICDFIVYKKPYEYYIECKSVHGNTLSIHSIPKKGKYGKLHGFHGNITDKQWDGLLEKSEIKGVVAGVLCWWVDRDVTLFLPISTLWALDYNKTKSVSYKIKDNLEFLTVEIPGKKRRVFFDYDMSDLFEVVEKGRRRDE